MDGDRAFPPPAPPGGGEGYEISAGRAFPAPRPLSRMMGAEKRAAEVAARRHGIIDLAQLIDAGLSRDAVRRRVDSGWLTRLHPGVFSVGAPTDLGRVQAGLIACGPESVATAWSAAALHGLLPFPAAVHIAARRDGPRPTAVRVSRPAVLPRWILRHRLRTAMVPETLLALAAQHYGDALDATDRAFVLRRTGTEQLRALLDDAAGRRGAAVLRDIVDGPRTRSHLERRFHALLEAARLPLPQANVRVNGHLVDFHWPAHRLVVETDGWASHGRRQQFERDRRRDLDHAAAGVTTIRVTYLQLTRESHAVCARLGAVLLRAEAVA